mgnify:CR=1 FL=1
MYYAVLFTLVNTNLQKPYKEFKTVTICTTKDEIQDKIKEYVAQLLSIGIVCTDSQILCNPKTKPD